jgi:transposase
LFVKNEWSEDTMITMKQVVGIDISKDSFDAQFAVTDEKQQQRFVALAKFCNTLPGFRKLSRWAKKMAGSSTAPLWFVMEATGVYHEHLAYYLAEQHQRVTIVLPTKMKNYVRSLDIKSKTDRLDARAIAQFGLERMLQPWQAPSTQLRILKALVREYDAATEQLTKIKNQLHAKDHSYQPAIQTLARLEAQHKLYEAQLKAIEVEIRALVEDDDDLRARIGNITSAQGVGFMTAVRVIGETNGFALITNAKQLTSYAGFDIRIKQSGLRSGKPSISHKGNSNLRRALFMPALAATRCNPALRRFYLRLVQSKGNKMVALVAVARKLLCLIYALWRDNVPYQPNYRQTAVL